MPAYEKKCAKSKERKAHVVQNVFSPQNPYLPLFLLYMCKSISAAR